jgi:RNA polymerase sigma factor (sigma-70 family)
MARMRQLKISKQVTNRDTPSLDKYLTEIGRVKLITAQEEVELARKIRKGDNDALEALCKANLRFVVSVAKQYQGQGLTLPDLISEGNLGLIKAAGRFDETRGFKFISYAVWWIRQQILQSLAEQARIVRLPLNKIGSINKINKAFAKLEQEHERPPTALELADMLEMTLDEVKTIMPYGAFVEIFPGTDGLLHVSELDWKRIERVEDVLKEGEMIDFQVVGKDPRTGKLKLSRKVLLPKPEGYVEREPAMEGERRDRGDRPRREFRDRGPRREN